MFFDKAVKLVTDVLPHADVPRTGTLVAAGFGMENGTSPEQLSRELRETVDDRYLDARRRVVALSLTAAGCMGLIGLYQLGIIKHIPEPPLPAMDADEVDASGEAYEKLRVGDAFLGFVSYGVTMLLAAAGGRERRRKQRWLPVTLAGKAIVDTAQAARLTVDQWTKHRAFCFWCLTAAAATFITLPLTFREARAAISEAAG
jgi:hypothetical protein